MPRMRPFKLLTACVIAATFLLIGAARALAQEPDDAADGSDDSHISSVQARSAPSWLQPGLIYEVFPHDFSREGNLNGVTVDLDRLKTLGVTVIWLMPIHPSGQLKKIGTNGSPYAVRDFYAIEPSYGTKEDLRHLVDEAHRRGMKVILDMVADHTAFDSVMMAHPNFYKHDKNGQLISPHGWHDVAALDYANPALRKYMIDMFIYWVKNFDVDGFRCDAAGEVPTEFWEQARTALDHLSPNLLMLAEASKPELERNAFSLDYAWPLLSKLDEVIMDGAPASDVQATIEKQQRRFPKKALHMLISDDHDTARAVVRYGDAAAIAASTLMFTLPGVPLLYNGMEVGDATPTSGPALFETLRIYWQSSQVHPEFQKFYRFIIPFRAQHPALWQGELEWVHNSDEQHIVSYLRQSGSEEILVVVNLSNTPFRGTVEAGSGLWQAVGNLRFKNKKDTQEVQVALPALSLDAFQFRIFEKQ